MAAIEEEIQEWGFDEAVLVVEKSNRGAMSLYKKLHGYRGIGGRRTPPNLVIDENGKVRGGGGDDDDAQEPQGEGSRARSKTSTRSR